MKRTAQDILNFVEDNDVKFAKLTFCDIFGNQKNISLFASELPRAFTQGISFDGSSIAGFMNVEESDLVLRPDPDTAAVLESLRQAGMSMIVDCDDFNCDVRLIEAVYGLPSGSVKVLDAAEREALAPATAWLPESEGNMLHLGSFASFVGGLEAAAGAAEGEYRASIVLAASVLISCVLAVIMSLAGGIVSLPLPALVLYQLAWAVLTLAFPLTRRY